MIAGAKELIAKNVLLQDVHDGWCNVLEGTLEGKARTS